MSEWLINTLAPWQWGLILAIPAAIIALYFLKLTRQSLEVPSTYLWTKTIEDLHVNSLWQRLRESLLLILQLIVVALLIVACLRPGCRGSELSGERFIFILDASASMQATDVSPNRFEEAKQQIAAKIEALDQLEPFNLFDFLNPFKERKASVRPAMLIVFSDTARTEQSFTENRSLLLRRLKEARVTNRRSNIKEALSHAASLANPGRSGDKSNPNDVKAADALPAEVYLFSDGGFPPEQEFQQGNLTFHYVKIGAGPKDVFNLAVAAFNAEPDPDKPSKRVAFGRIENFGLEEVEVLVGLYLDGDSEPRDVSKVRIPKATRIGIGEDDQVPKAGEGAQERYLPGSAGVEFDVSGLDAGKLELRIEKSPDVVDHLAVDDSGWTTIQASRRLNLLLVTPRNDALDLVLSTKLSQRHAAVTPKTPDFLATEAYQQQAAAGAWDLIIYDQCAPPKMPPCNTLTIGRLPPGGEWTYGVEKGVVRPGVIDTDRSHPLMQFVELSDVQFAEAKPLKGPSKFNSLIEADCGPIVAIGQRDRYEDIVFGFDIYGQSMGPDGKLEWNYNTDWVLRHSFAVFIKNLLEYCNQGNDDFPPGARVELTTKGTVDRIEIETPRGRKPEMVQKPSRNFSFTDTEEIGVYDVREGFDTEATQHFTVNLFDSNEGNIAARQFVVVGAEQEAVPEAVTQVRQDFWRWLLAVAFLVLMAEWYIYNKRVYL